MQGTMANMLAMLAGASGGGSPAGPRAVPDAAAGSPGDSAPFQRTFAAVLAASGEGARGRSAGREASGAGREAARVLAATPAGRELVGRLETLVGSGELDPAALEALTPAERVAFLVWVLEGAGGRFQPAGADLSALADLFAADPAAAADAVRTDLAARAETGLDPAGSASAVSSASAATSGLLADFAGECLGLDALTPEERHALSEAVVRALRQEIAAARAEAAPGEGTPALAPEALARAVGRALEATGLETKLPPAALSPETLSAGLLKALGVESVTVSVENPVPARELLAELARVGVDVSGQARAAEAPAEGADASAGTGAGSLRAARSGAASEPSEATAADGAEAADARAVRTRPGSAPSAQAESAPPGEENAGRGNPAPRAAEAQAEENRPFRQAETGSPPGDRPSANTAPDSAPSAPRLAQAGTAGTAAPAGGVTLTDAPPAAAAADGGAGPVLSATGAAPASAADAPPPAMEPGPLPAWTEAQGRALQNIQRVEQAVQMAARRGLHRVTMDLSPPDLGRVTVELRFRDGTLAARIQTENLEARAALQAGVQQLRANLEAQGVRLENFDVTQDEQSPLPDGRGHSGGRQGGEDGGESPAEGGAPSFDPEAEAEVLVAAMRDDSASAGAGALNVVA